MNSTTTHRHRYWQNIGGAWVRSRWHDADGYHETYVEVAMCDCGAVKAAARRHRRAQPQPVEEAPR